MQPSGDLPTQRSQEMQAFHARMSAAVAALAAGAPVSGEGEGDSIEMTADPTTHAQGEDECAVCLVSLKPGDVVRELSCLGCPQDPKKKRKKKWATDRSTSCWRVEILRV